MATVLAEMQNLHINTQTFFYQCLRVEFLFELQILTQFSMQLNLWKSSIFIRFSTGNIFHQFTPVESHIHIFLFVYSFTAYIETRKTGKRIVRILSTMCEQKTLWGRVRRLRT